MSNLAKVFKADCLIGKVAFITGGASGICKGIAQDFMQYGADVVIVSRNQSRLDAAAAELKSACPARRCVGVAADVRKGQDVEDAIRKALGTFGKIDVVVNGAAGNFLCPLASMSYNAFRTVIEIDTLGTYNVSKAIFELWFREHGGAIINISATLHYVGMMLQAHAGAAKAAVDALTKHCAVEWGSMGIRVNGIAPGPIADTEGYRRLAPQDKASQREAESHIPLQRMGLISDVTASAVFLASEAAQYITGHTLVVDGGAWMIGQWHGRPKL